MERENIDGARRTSIPDHDMRLGNRQFKRRYLRHFCNEIGVRIVFY